MMGELSNADKLNGYVCDPFCPHNVVQQTPQDNIGTTLNLSPMVAAQGIECTYTVQAEGCTDRHCRGAPFGSRP